MRTVHVQELSAEKFGLYGTFADMLHAAGPHIGTNPIEFYRNMTTVYSPGASVGLSITKVYRRPLVIDTYEYHNTCAEAMMPLDGDAYIHVAPAGPADHVPYDEVEVFPARPEGHCSMHSPHRRDAPDRRCPAGCGGPAVPGERSA